ncbi:scavenger receptor cysteine-rich type 1 protein M130-like isoform X2 [Dysidea avara]|uniref:scavenger receptor cysteine-rich type 1 protein M130-like isoform X2 n=1 Tax=Dysidea avara TaxID=196820 RepID=UPI00331FEE80
MSRLGPLRRFIARHARFNETSGFGELRINGGGDSGRLEFQLSDGTWGTVCDDGFDDNAGNAACKQLGYDDFSGFVIPEYDSSLPIAVCYTFCLGDEDKYTDCVYTICGDSFTCQHIEDVGIKCGHFSTTKLILIILSPALFVIFVVIIIISCVICCICYSKRRTRRSYYRVRSLQVTAATVTVAKVTTATVTAAIVTKQTKPATYSTVPPTEYQSVSPPPTTQ